MSRSEQAIFTNLCMVYDHAGNILVQDRLDPQWPGITFPGGHVERGESFTDSVIREVYEETGVRYEIEKLAVVHENFFDGKGGVLDGLSCHEICLYYLMKPRGTKELCSNSFTNGVGEDMHWIPIKDLDKYKAFPSFMKEYLSLEHEGIEHIITDERLKNIL